MQKYADEENFFFLFHCFTPQITAAATEEENA